MFLIPSFSKFWFCVINLSVRAFRCEVLPVWCPQMKISNNLESETYVTVQVHDLESSNHVLGTISEFCTKMKYKQNMTLF